MKENIELKWYEKKQGVTFKDKVKGKEHKKTFLEKKERKEKSQEKPFKKSEKNSNQTKDSFYFKSIEKEKKESLFSLEKVPEDAKKILEDFNTIVESTHPLTSKQKSLLPKEIRELSHYLTDERGERRLGYMNQTSLLGAYVYYFSWWNLVRLVRLFSNMPKSFFALKAPSIFLDIGSGPLTVPIALFLSRPELREKNITFYCMDLSKEAMLFGENIFLSIAAKIKCAPWKIIRVKGGLDSSIKEKVDFITSANFFNELSDDKENQSESLAKKYTDSLMSFFDREKTNARCLIVEPGDPHSSHLLTLMRLSFIKKGFSPISPCPHSFNCPMNGCKGEKWCNFAFSTESAPSFLKKLSEKANLPKDRAVLSFIALQKKEKNAPSSKEIVFENEKKMKIRIASDKIFLPGGKTGYYACSEIGLLLVISEKPLLSGDLLSVAQIKKELPLDKKSGAKILKI